MDDRDLPQNNSCSEIPVLRSAEETDMLSDNICFHWLLSRQDSSLTFSYERSYESKDWSMAKTPSAGELHSESESESTGRTKQTLKDE